MPFDINFCSLFILKMKDISLGLYVYFRLFDGFQRILYPDVLLIGSQELQNAEIGIIRFEAKAAERHHMRIIVVHAVADAALRVCFDIHNEPMVRAAQAQ